jgi:hypothetical protein
MIYTPRIPTDKDVEGIGVIFLLSVYINIRLASYINLNFLYDISNLLSPSNDLILKYPLSLLPSVKNTALKFLYM